MSTVHATNIMHSLTVTVATKIQSCTAAFSFDAELLSDSEDKCEGAPIPSCSTPVFANAMAKNVLRRVHNAANFIAPIITTLSLNIHCCHLLDDTDSVDSQYSHTPVTRSELLVYLILELGACINAIGRLDHSVLSDNYIFYQTRAPGKLAQLSLLRQIDWRSLWNDNPFHGMNLDNPYTSSECVCLLYSFKVGLKGVDL